MWLRRLLLIPILLGFVGLGVWVYFFYEPKPDARLACYYGGYDFSDGLIGSVTPTTGIRSLRLTLMSGETWKLDPAPDAGDMPTTFTMSRGWTGDVTPGASVEFGSCTDGVVRIRAKE